MPFVSRSQARFMFAKHPEKAKEWAAKTDFENLPETAQEGKTIAKVKKHLDGIKKRSDVFPKSNYAKKRVGA